MQSEQVIVEKLRLLPSQQLAEVEDFVDFLVSRAHKSAALVRLLSIAPTLVAAGVAPMSEDEVAEVVQQARAERRSRPGR